MNLYEDWNSNLIAIEVYEKYSKYAHKTLIHHGHSVKRTCPFRHGRVEENKLIPLYKKMRW